MLSTPGKLTTDSVYTRLHTLYPTATGPLIVHRLDMATSGLLLVAKTKEIHYALQKMFASRRIQKRYTAWLNGIVTTDEGIINLPICPDYDNRPYQWCIPNTGNQPLPVIKCSDGKTEKPALHSIPSPDALTNCASMRLIRTD